MNFPYKNLIVFTITALIFLLATYFFTYLYQISGCKKNYENDPDVYISACGGLMGDYEHGAIFLNLEPNAISALKNSDILFLGSSRTQIGFSTNNTREYFNKKNISYYLLGFGYVESMNFSKAILEKFSLKPKVVVINVDPFFWAYTSPIAVGLIDKNLLTWQGYYLKKWTQEIMPTYCKYLICKPRELQIYRRRSNGEWIWSDTWQAPDGGHPLKSPERVNTKKEEDEIISGAKEFFKSIQLPKECIVLTATPNDRMDAKSLAKTIANELGLKTIFPDLEKIVMLDEDHMNLPTAEQWSKLFMQDLDPILSRCIH